MLSEQEELEMLRLQKERAMAQVPVASQPKEDPKTLLNPIGEGIAHVGTSALLAPLSGFLGLAGAALPGPQGQGADWASKVQGLAYQPKTQMGKESVKAFSYLPEKIAQGFDWLGGKATDLATEKGASPEVAAAAGTAATVIPNAALLALGGRGITNPAKPKALAPHVQEAFDAGLNLTPVQAGSGFVPETLQGLAGTAKLEKLASMKNEKNFNNLVKEDFNIPKNQELTTDVLDGIISSKGQAYEAVKNSVKLIKPDQKFASDLQKLRGDFDEAAKTYPDVLKNDQVESLISSLNVPASPTAMVEMTKKLRKDASTNLKSFDDPAKRELGFAQRNAATALENMIDRALISVGKNDLVSNWRDARQTIAKAYDVQAAMNEVTGEISALKLGEMYKKGKPFTGGMEKVAKFARAFKQSAREVTGITDSSQFGYGDLLTGALGVLTGGAGAAMGSYPATAAGILAIGARPALRHLLLTNSKQGALMPPPGILGALPVLPRQKEDDRQY